MRLAQSYNNLENLLHPSIEIEWAGMRSDIRRMSIGGWVFQMIRHADAYRSQLVFKNSHCGAVGYCREVDEGELMDLHYRGSFDPSRLIGGKSVIVLGSEVRNRFHVQMEMAYSIESVSVGLVRPNGELVTFDPHTKEDQQPEELIVIPEDVPELLEKIRQAQQPRAKEILRDQRKRNELSELSMKAKILTFGNVA
jgi:hypothetical protein